MTHSMLFAEWCLAHRRAEEAERKLYSTCVGEEKPDESLVEEVLQLRQQASEKLKDFLAVTSELAVHCRAQI